MPTTGAPPASQLLLTGWHTSALDGYSHAVTDGAFTDDVRRRHGQFETVCGLVIYLTASVIPCCRPCPRSTTLLRTHATSHPPAADTGPLRRRLGWLRPVSGSHERGDQRMIPAAWPYSQEIYEAFTAMKREPTVKGSGGVVATVVVTTRRDKVRVSIQPPFTWKAIMEPGWWTS